MDNSDHKLIVDETGKPIPRRPTLRDRWRSMSSRLRIGLVAGAAVVASLATVLGNIEKITSFFTTADEAVPSNHVDSSRYSEEVLHRIASFEHNLTRYESEEGFTYFGVLTPLTDDLIPNHSFSDGPLFPEFQRRNLRSVIVEWKEGLSTDAKLGAADKLLTVISELRQLEPPGSNENSTLEERAERIEQARTKCDEAKQLVTTINGASQ